MAATEIDIEHTGATTIAELDRRAVTSDLHSVGEWYRPATVAGRSPAAVTPRSCACCSTRARAWLRSLA
jgi:hypothetical protein